MNVKDLHLEFLSYLKNLSGTIVLIMHPQADPDALGALLGIQHFITEINPNIDVKVFNPTISVLAQKLLELLNLEYSSTNTIPDSTPIIFLDYSSGEYTFTQSNSDISIIDHHVSQKLPFNLLFDFRDDRYNSTTEIIASLYKSCNISLNEKIVKAMLAGIVFDTRRFLYTNERLFEIVSYLLHDFPNAYADIIPLFTNPRSKAEKIACIKAAQRMKRYVLNDMQILISNVSSFEAAAARSLIFLGGDIAFVIAIRDDQSRISIRSSKNFMKNTKISLGKDLIPAIITKFRGNGGGHDGAAGYNTTTKIELKEFQEFVLATLKSMIIFKSD